ncbi:hypothetical protein V6E43_24305, partial [Enterobacter hormaechei]
NCREVFQRGIALFHQCPENPFTFQLNEFIYDCVLLIRNNNDKGHLRVALFNGVNQREGSGTNGATEIISVVT